MENGLLLLLTAIVMAVGLTGTVLPVIPGLGLIWLAGVGYGLVTGLGRQGVVAIGLMTVLAVLGGLAGVMVPARRGRAQGLSARGMAAALALGTVGFFAIPVVGGPLGALAGVLIVKYQETGDWISARRATWSVLLGFGIGAGLQLAAGLAMVLVWAVWALWAW